jgi:glutamyl-tRNA reductase
MRLEELKGLDSLTIGETQITNDGIRKLKKALPNTSIGGVAIPTP